MAGPFFNGAFFGSGFFALLEEVSAPVDGSGLRIIRRRRRPGRPAVRPRDLDRLPEDIAREQRETERYLESLERKAPQQAPPESAEPVADQAELAAEPELADALARAAAAQLIATAAARAKEEEQRARERKRTALLLLALD
jgi:hypothetical protein